MRRFLRFVPLTLLLSILFAAPPAGSNPAVPVRPGPIDGISGRWLKLPAGSAFRPDVVADWAPFSKGRFRSGAAGPEWIGDAAWETAAAKGGSWSRVATWGWVYWPSKTPSKRSAGVLFLSVDGPRRGIAWLPLGPRDDEAWLERMERSGARLGSLPFQNASGVFRFLAAEKWPAGEPERIGRRPKRGVLVPPGRVDAVARGTR